MRATDEVSIGVGPNLIDSFNLKMLNARQYMFMIKRVKFPKTKLELFLQKKNH